MSKTKLITILFFTILFINQTLLTVAFFRFDKMDHNMNHEIKITGNFEQDIANIVVPSVRPFYGKDLGLNFSNLQNIDISIRKMAMLAPYQGRTPISLNESQLKRYIQIGTEPTITCQYCCGVMTLVRENGFPTCGCAHSIAMRGTAAFLIKYYPDLTNEQISYELMRQKGMYFPGIMQKKLAEQLAAGQENFTPDIKYLTMNFSENQLVKLKKTALNKGFNPDTESLQMIGDC